MGDEFKPEISHERHGLVLHAATPAELRVPVFFPGKGVQPEQVVVQLHLRQQVGHAGLCGGYAFRVHVMHQRNGVGSERRQHGGHVVIRHGNSHQVSGDREPVSPVRGSLAVQRGFRLQHAVACRPVCRRMGDENIHRVNFVGQRLFAGHPVFGAERLRERPERRRSIRAMCAGGKRTEAGSGRNARVKKLERIGQQCGKDAGEMYGQDIAVPAERTGYAVVPDAVHRKCLREIEFEARQVFSGLENSQHRAPDVAHCRVHPPVEAGVGDVGTVVGKVGEASIGSGVLAQPGGFFAQNDGFEVVRILGLGHCCEEEEQGKHGAFLSAHTERIVRAKVASISPLRR